MTVATSSTYFAFREAQNMDELKTMLQVRYRGYLASKCASLMHTNPHGLDLDCYDLQSRHFGLFQYEGKKKKVIGYMRLALDTVSPQLKDIWRLSMYYPDLVDDLEFSHDRPYPVMGHLHDAAPVFDYYRQVRKEGESMFEASRMVIEADLRSSMHLSKFMIESALAISMFSRERYDHCMLACVPKHSRYYERFGFENLHTDIYDDVHCQILVNTPDRVPAALAEQATHMAEVYHAHGATFHCPQYTKVFVPQSVSPKPSISAVAAIG